MEIWVIRHGQTMDNFTRTLAGHQPGKLSKLGETQAQKTGKALQNEFFHCAYVSDLNRTKKTYELISISFKHCKNIKVFYESLIREKSGGDLEGQSLDLPKKLAQENNIDIRLFRPPNGECWNDVYNRAETFLMILIERHIKQNLNVEPLYKSFVPRKDTNLKNEEKNKIEEKPENKLLFEEEEKLIILDKNSKENLTKKNSHFEDKLKEKNEKNDIEVKRKLSENIQKKQLPELKKKISLIEEKSKDPEYYMKKILVVSHGGFIMELFNVINFLIKKEPPVYANRAQNCSINMLNVYCRNTKGRCCEKCPRNTDCIQIDILRKNDIKHLI